MFQAADAAATYNERLAIVFGVITLVLSLSTFLSCRTCISWLKRLGIQNPMHSKGYALFYRYHLYYWWAFGVALVAHFMVAVLHTGLPQSDDPDANIHWIILGLGLFSAISAVGLFSSCRILPRLAAMAKNNNPLDNMVFRVFFKYHSYYWFILAMLVAAHFGVSYWHAGIWPGAG